jgi:cytoskeletal protein RodZ
MPPIGETLRDARTRQSIDIADVEQATKIRSKYLRALEAEEFDRLPGSTFVRQFLRTYSDYLGLDSQLLLEEYRTRHESPAAGEPQQFAPPSSTRGREPRRRAQGAGPRPSGATLIAGGAIAVLALLLIIGLIIGTDEGADDEPAPPEAAEPGPAERRGGQAADERPEEGPLQLTVTPAAATYVCVEDRAGEELFEGEISSPETIRGRDALRLNLGNTQVELEVNGEEVPIEQSAEPIALELTAQGQEELPEDQRPCT